jgi:hypothetical protein
MKKPPSFHKALLAVLLMGWAGVTASRAGSLDGVKENYFLSLPEYVDWPATVFGRVFSPFVFGVLGDGDFAKTLTQKEKGVWLNGHPVSVLPFPTFDPQKAGDLRQCQILFISASQKGSLKEILKALQGAPVLTVSDLGHFPSDGGMITFAQEGGRILLTVNLEAVKKTGINVSARLLQVAKLYSKKP